MNHTRWRKIINKVINQFKPAGTRQNFRGKELRVPDTLNNIPEIFGVRDQINIINKFVKIDSFPFLNNVSGLKGRPSVIVK